MQQLNLPSFDAKLRKEEGKIRIFDLIRKRFVVCTPEEWVRQHLIHYFIEVLGYPRALFKVESGLKGAALQQRTDIVVCDRTGAPWLLVECKAPEIIPGEAVFHQALVYNSRLGAPFVGVSNGLTHYCMRKRDGEDVSAQTKFLDGFPAYPVT